ncbi:MULTISPECIES: PTS sugar transporter subunit IIA [Enterococcus]|uniref:PTS sugar transporter subunit IIA n=1 Tax=Candidatus Enterococcus murrayae TaxID=2815321 RepID=A0ABS3HES6_9ENTE|nr:fructose PTS transporter subunit IIA [Enterococcus sp. MJM16]MBO0451959.1 PTS sugar transporter subunit IIA [Enterococcus sp. MJM16]
MTEIRDVLKPAFIDFDLKATDKQAAISELAHTFIRKGVVTNDSVYLEAVAKREEESTTGIGFGVAIPHGKSAAVTEPSLAFGRSHVGIQYDSMDGKPVHLMFLIAVPETSNDEHLRILSKLSRKLMHEDVRQKLMTVTDVEEIYQIFE